ncbi:MAG TPA: alpha/beta fold hydrolase [Myxococcales bacterium]|jgi:dienelactone hydrolase
MRERTLHFGVGGGLAGVLTEPSPEALREGAPAIVLSNVGMHSRIGPYRMWVELSRRLASEGFLTLRFDQSGFGDSGTVPSAVGPLEAAALEQRAAIDALAERGATGVVLLGFCSGVDPAHAASLVDPRVRGVVYLDGYAYPTPQFFVRRWTLRFLRARTWLNAIDRRRQRLLQLKKGEAPHAPPVFDRTYPPPERLASELRALAGRGVEMLFLWSRGREHEFNHEAQFFSMLRVPDLRGRVQVRFLDGCDHLFSTAAQRAKLFEAVTRFVVAKFGGQEASAAAHPAAVTSPAARAR